MMRGSGRNSSFARRRRKQPRLKSEIVDSETPIGALERNPSVTPLPRQFLPGGVEDADSRLRLAGDARGARAARVRDRGALEDRHRFVHRGASRRVAGFKVADQNRAPGWLGRAVRLGGGGGCAHHVRRVPGHQGPRRRAHRHRGLVRGDGGARRGTSSARVRSPPFPLECRTNVPRAIPRESVPSRRTPPFERGR